MRLCWCGNTTLVPFSPEYGKCQACNTLVYLRDTNLEKYLVLDDEKDYYGKKYWLEHQHEKFGYDDIYTRARSDLSGRNLHWLKTLLKYRLPIADVLELGCAHGSFVALMHHTGYHASGIEMSPWVVSFGRDTFGVPISIGPIEKLQISPRSLDVIVLFDVLEHLPDPMSTLGHCIKLLKQDGILLVQTPQFKEEMNYEKLLELQDEFLKMLVPDEHIFLYSEQSVKEFFKRLGMNNLYFEPAFFPQYDMFFVVSRDQLKTNTASQVESFLLTTPNGRIILALLDLYQKELNMVRELRDSEDDRRARLEKIHILTAQLQETQSQLQETQSQLRGAFIGYADLESRFEKLRSDARILLSRRWLILLEKTKLSSVASELRKELWSDIDKNS